MPINGDAERLRRLQLVTDAALAHLELDELLGELLARIREALAADTAAILLHDDDRNELVARAAVGLEEEVERSVRIPIDGGFAGRVAGERRPIIVEDVDRAEILNPILREKGVKSLLGVPLVVEGQLLGVLHVGTLSPRAFSSEDVELLQLVADRAAIAIAHARLFATERQARARLEQLQIVTDAALSHLELEELLRELLSRIHDILAADTVAILMREEETEELVARAAVGLEEVVERGVRIPIGRGFAGRVAAMRQPIVLEHVDHVNVLNPVLREKGIKSLLGVPLIVGDNVLGVLHVGTLEPRVFTEDDVELLQLVAARAALAIEKARVHDELVRLDQLKLNFVAVASHELRTPATSVYGITATLRDRGDSLSAEERQRLEDALWEQSKRLRRLIEQLLDLSRLDAKSIPIQPQTVSLGEVLDEVVAAAGAEEKADIRIDVDEEVEVVADRLALERILLNLVVNALRHGKPPVVLSVLQRDTYLRVRVEDSGDGVPADVVPRLFERFERGGPGEGSGLGLAIAQTYARAHGGDLLYDPTANSGARFELILPRG
ncbi:MAG TPA: GAF domain-containing protein [Gaiellaceae bacterium]